MACVIPGRSRKTLSAACRKQRHELAPAHPLVEQVAVGGVLDPGLPDAFQRRSMYLRLAQAPRFTFRRKPVGAQGGCKFVDALPCVQ